ncbi:hypothetical protein BTO30_12005 [Domibacillus antri]|uniref:DUF624 domain-containing protein n=1 Tax=Domibacillus antri TaxID=1714264 RepID=A0A1Q8Q3I9_9BACI|nr:hypothetical protein [Domibacillus antri]OLN21923.1 hypothetical protein BTO30_12005 [Domibacillus antri]
MKSVSQILLKSGSLIYLHIVEVLLVSLMWSVLIIPAVVILPIQTAILYLAVMVIPATTAAIYAINERFHHKKKLVKLFWKGFFTLYRRSVGVSLILSLAILIPVSTWWYYIQFNSGYGFFLFAVFQTYLCVMFLLTQMYAPALVAVHGMKTIEAMNQSIRYFLKYPWYTVVFFIQVLSITGLLALTFIGFFLLYAGMISILIRTSTFNIQEGSQENKRKQEEKTFVNHTLHT